MLCYAVLLCCAVGYYATQCYTMLRNATRCYATLRYAALCYAMLRYASPCYERLAVPRHNKPEHAAGRHGACERRVLQCEQRDLCPYEEGVVKTRKVSR